MNADSTIKKLLNLRLTKFEYGFCLGLQAHQPTPEQEAVLARLLNRYSLVREKEGSNESKQPNGNIGR